MMQCNFSFSYRADMLFSKMFKTDFINDVSIGCFNQARNDRRGLKSIQNMSIYVNKMYIGRKETAQLK